MKKILTRLHVFLSHHSYLYALIVGIGIVVFWRGVWHTVDLVHSYVQARSVTSVLDSGAHPWWDGPASFVVGIVMLYVTKAFISSFIGNELILSGLRTEKKLTHVTEHELKNEVSTIAEIKNEIDIIAHKLDDLEIDIKDHHLK